MKKVSLILFSPCEAFAPNSKLSIFAAVLNKEYFEIKDLKLKITSKNLSFVPGNENLTINGKKIKLTAENNSSELIISIPSLLKESILLFSCKAVCDTKPINYINLKGELFYISSQTRSQYSVGFSMDLPAIRQL